MNPLILSGWRWWPLWLLTLIFALPPALAAWFYLHHQQLPVATKQRGELLDRGAPLDWRRMRPLEHQAQTRSLDAGRWYLLALPEQPCDSGCQKRLWELRQIKHALAGAGPRVIRLLWLEDEAQWWRLGPALTEGARGIVAAAGLVDSGPWQRGRVYILDPDGRAVLGFDAQQPAREILHDLARLLKATRSWSGGADYGHR